jgi:hypothetical protein
VLFAMLVVMALVTTFMTAPLLTLVMGGRPWDVGHRASAYGPDD